MSTVVISHGLDEAAGVWRIVVGDEVFEQVPMLDTEGATLLDDDDLPLTERRLVGHEQIRDVVFAASDARWQGKTDEEIAAEQREIVRAAMETQSASEPPAPVVDLPGVGEPL
jgi:hypothetical protein